MDIVVANVDYSVMEIVHDTIQRSPYDGGRYGGVLVVNAAVAIAVVDRDERRRC